MNRSKGLRTLLIMLCTNVLTWQANHPAQAQGDAPATIDVQAIVIQSAEGAQVRRAGWTGFTHLSLGAELQAGDLVNPVGKPVRVICGDYSQQVINVIGPLPCPKQRRITRQRDMALAAWQRGTMVDATIPYLISPRATLVLDGRPRIIWHSVIGADSYRVTVRGDGLEWSSLVKGATSDSLVYPDKAPALAPNVAYTVEIAALANGAEISSSAQEDAPGISFKVIPASILAVLDDVPSKLSTITESDVVKLILSQVYADNQLYAAALDQLNPSQKIVRDTRFSTSPIPQLVLGDIYLQTGVKPEAQKAYRLALDLALKADDLESQTLALIGLARLEINPQRQAELAKDAIDQWTALGAMVEAKRTAEEFGVTPSSQ
jgi:hypothetical protein